MKSLSLNHRYIPLPFLLTIVLLAIIGSPGCSNNPVTEDPEEHSEPVGLVVFENDAEIVRVENGTVTGSFDLLVNQLSSHYKLEFLDEDGDLFVPDDPDFSPGEIIANPDILEIVRDEPTDWDFHLRGTAVGSTTIQLTVKHGGHNDFISVAIPVAVQP